LTRPGAKLMLDGMSPAAPSRLRCAAAVGILLGLPGWFAPSSLWADPPKTVRFTRDVRPILSQNCFFCHGPDEKHREAELRLDLPAAAPADLGGHAAIVPGKPDESELLRRVTSHDDDEMMPPPASKKARLSDDQIAILRQWIEEGAPYEGHWAFLPLSTDPPPTPRLADWARNPIDAFILARLEAEGLTPSPETDRSTLIRRLYLDLLGLLPTPEEVRQFVDDSDPRAYELLVDRALASPHYGERWGRHWLDQARYADSNGYAIDAEREMWPYRDWVIRALNDDLPFDRFTIEQLAGDLLPDAKKEQLIASGFHRNTLINQEGGSDPEQFRVEAVMDRVNTTGAVWLGLTVGCAQCHSHKFDPITQREYYQLFAFFNSTEDVNDRGPTVKYTRGELIGPPPNEQPEPAPEDPAALAQRRAAWERDELARLESLEIAAAANASSSPPEAQAAAGAPQPVVWVPVHYESFRTESSAGFRLLDDNSLLSDGRASPNDAYLIDVTTTVPQVAAVRLRTLTHESLPSNGPGLAGNGNFVLTDFGLTVDGKKQILARAGGDHEQPGFPVEAAFDDDPKSGWAVNIGPGGERNAKLNADHEAWFVLAEPLAAAGKTLRFRLAHDLNKTYLVGRVLLEVAATPPPPANNRSDKQRANNQALLAALRIGPAERNPDQANRVQEAFDYLEAEAQSAKKKADPNVAQQMIMRQREQPRETYVLTRGNFTRPDVAAGRIAPAVLSAVVPQSPAAAQPLSRLDLARWLVSPENPLTPRVTMNRIWMRYFGRGLVETDEDFGAQGAAPTHPELLDWLAGELIRGSWSVKHVHRLIVTSAAYRQASTSRPELTQRDPRNLLLGRQQRVRLDAEILRDAALCASGLLNPTLGGPSVHPPQPEGVYAFTQVRKNWKTDTGPDRYRRGMYTFFFRSSPYPLFSTFDAPDFQTACTRRPRSNTPLQALNMANDPAFLEMAGALAARVTREVPGDAAGQLAARIERAFVLCLCRQPAAEEQSVLTAYHLGQQAEYARDPQSAARLIAAAGQGDPQLSADDPAAAAALVCVARVILNTDNFIVRE
jgi:mono/diheme cytochrome c family protein